jgi:hypothetical protein
MFACDAGPDRLTSHRILLSLVKIPINPQQTANAVRIAQPVDIRLHP